MSESEKKAPVVEILALLGAGGFGILYMLGIAPFQDTVIIILTQIAVLLASNNR
jgi:hypothetical protein